MSELIRTASKLKTAAAANAVVVTDAIAARHLRLDTSDTDEKAYVNHLLEAAQNQVEAYTNRKLVSQTWYYYLTDFPKNQIVLPYSPVSSITSVKYESGTTQTWDSGNYWYNVDELPTSIVYDSGHPAVDEDVFPGVTVEYVVGWADGAAVPEDLKLAITLIAGHMYDNRRDNPDERFTVWQSLCYPWRVWHRVDENE